MWFQLPVRFAQIQKERSCSLPLFKNGGELCCVFSLCCCQNGQVSTSACQSRPSTLTKLNKKRHLPTRRLNLRLPCVYLSPPLTSVGLSARLLLSPPAGITHADVKTRVCVCLCPAHRLFRGLRYKQSGSERAPTDVTRAIGDSREGIPEWY